MSKDIIPAVSNDYGQETHFVHPLADPAIFAAAKNDEQLNDLYKELDRAYCDRDFPVGTQDKFGDPTYPPLDQRVQRARYAKSAIIGYLAEQEIARTVLEKHD